MSASLLRRWSWAAVLLGCGLSFATAGGPERKPPQGAAEARPAKVLDGGELEEAVQTAKLSDAVEILDQAIERNPQKSRIQSLRHDLAQRFIKNKQFNEAIDQYEKLRDFLIANLGEEPNAANLSLTATGLHPLYWNRGEKEKSWAVFDECLTAVRARNEQHPEPHVVYGIAAVLAGRARWEEARQITGEPDITVNLAPLVEECGQIERLLEQAPEEPSLLDAWDLLMKQRLAHAAPQDKPLLEAALLARVQANVVRSPDSSDALWRYLGVQIGAITRLIRDDPEEAESRMKAAVALVEASPVRGESIIESGVERLKSLEPRLAIGVQRKRLIGQAAPPWDAQAWAHGEPRTLESLRGKVVLVDFWAVWCGPCIATFPDLKSLHDKFHDRGLEIVGVTRQYGYVWNDQTKEAEEAQAKVDLPTEQKALDQVLTHHQLPYPTMIVPQGTKMFDSYGVDGIPHAVLIDRKGIVRLIRVGSQESSAKAIREMVETLIAE